MSRIRASVAFGSLTVVGIAAFLYPLWLQTPRREEIAHSNDAPLITAAVAALAIVALATELQRGTMNGTLVAVLGVLAAAGGILRIFDLPGGGSGIFFLVVIAGAAFGPRFGVLLGLCSMAVSALLTGGMGPWLPFQMLGLSWLGGVAGLLGRITEHLPSRVEAIALAAYGWMWGFIYGAILNVWFWPFGVSDGALSWEPGLSIVETLTRYWHFYVTTSLVWDAAAAFTNAVFILALATALLTSFRRIRNRLSPSVLVAEPIGEAPISTV